jgi:hypothetical protein
MTLEIVFWVMLIAIASLSIFIYRGFNYLDERLIDVHNKMIDIDHKIPDRESEYDNRSE